MGNLEDSIKEVEGRKQTSRRSPGYPSMSLEQALAKSKLIFDQEGRNRIPGDSVVRPLSYSSLNNGAAKRALSTLRQYGLISRLSDDLYSLSDDALDTILLDTNDPKRIDTIKRIAFNPPIFSQLHEEYGWSLPSDSTLAHFLIMRDFQKDAADQVIKLYRETLTFILLLDPGATEETQTLSQCPTGQPQSKTDVSATKPLTSDAWLFDSFPKKEIVYRIPIGKSEAVVSFTGTVTGKTINRLIRHLDLIKEDYPDEDLAGGGQDE